MTITRGRFGTTLLLTLLLSVAGCGDSVVGPLPPNGGTGGTGGAPEPSGPEILVITEDQSVRYVTLRAGAVDETGGPESPGAIQASAVIDGAAGGRLECGRFLLAVPPGAFEGKGTISMSMANSDVMVVDIEIDPIELNEFKLPVKLCLLTDGTTIDEEDLQIYWWDPGQEEWKGLGCDKDLSDDQPAPGATEGILTHLNHFSRYSGGKAGW